MIEQTSWTEVGEQELGSGSVDNHLCGFPGAITIMQVRDDGDQGANCESRKNSRSILKIQLVRFADELDVGCERKRSLKNDPRFSA